MTINGKLDAKPVALYTERCLNYIHNQAGCNLCDTVCPTDAIYLYNQQVRFDPENCIGCGGCQSVCPTEVFTPHKKWVNAISYILDELNNAHVELMCSQHQGTPLQPPKGAVAKLDACLVILSPVAWLELGMACNARIRLDACQNCEIAPAVLPYIRDSIDLANEWLRAIGKQGNLVPVVETEDAVSSASPRRIIEVGTRRVSRRGFFRSLINPVFAGQPEPSSATAPPARRPEKRTLYLPTKLQRFEDLYREKLPSVESVLEWPDVSIDETCVVCGACTDYCPTGALAAHTRDEQFTISFTPSKCITCEVCVLACVTRALALTKTEQSEPFQPRNIYSHPIVTCVKCGHPSIETDSRLCYWCLEEPPITAIFEDAKRWLLRDGE